VRPDDLLARLDPEQRVAAAAVRGPVCILAGAGTGKTRTITHRIAYAVLTGTVPAEHVLAVTFTARAAGEMRSRLRGLGVGSVQARTFHAAALRQLQYFWPRVVGGDLPTLVESKYPLVNAAAGRARLQVGPADVRDLISEIEWAKARLVAPDGYEQAAAAARRQPPRPAAEVAAVYAGYEAGKSRHGAVDFDDLLLLTAAAIEDHDDVAEEVQSRYRWLVVDEYQDVNPLQQRLLDAWVGGREDLCVVGDDDQTIYSFAGASREYLLRFPERHPETTVVRLVRDYRSTPQVVGLANAVIAADPTRRGAPKRLEAQLPDGPPPTFAEHDDEPAEARSVAVAIRRLMADGVAASEIAVLYRINAQSEAYENALAAAGIPYVVRGGERFFERREVREALAALRAASRAPDESAPLAAQVREALLHRVEWDPERPPDGAGAARDRWEALAALARLADDLPPATRFADFVAELDQRAADQHVPTVDGVTLASLHSAKGLEWDAVFLVGLVEGTLPIQHATTPEEIAEERRLLYVGITRARRHLALSWALARAAGGRRGRRRSSFLDAVQGVPARERPPARRDRSGTLVGKPVADLAPEDVAVFERLRSWRKNRADDLGQPAYCVFTDATLRAIASSRPASRDELLRISGVSDGKWTKFGPDVLALVADP
jgi:DNA helicase II / ATP-dependent DNA helicase PcrA